MSGRGSLRRVLGLGSVKGGVRHWWMQRLTAIALVPLSIWFITSVTCLAGADHARVTSWISDPFVALILILMLITMFYHLRLGLQVVIEDYIHTKTLKLMCMLGNDFINIALAVACAFSVLKIAV